MLKRKHWCPLLLELKQTQSSIRRLSLQKISPKLNHVLTKFLPLLVRSPRASRCPSGRSLSQSESWLRPKPCQGSPRWSQLIFYTNFWLMRLCNTAQTQQALATQSWALILLNAQSQLPVLIRICFNLYLGCTKLQSSITKMCTSKQQTRQQSDQKTRSTRGEQIKGNLTLQTVVSKF